MDDLTPKQQAFVREYLIDLNATKAAERAGYSPKTATEQGSRLLTNVKVASAVQKEMDKRAERTEITQDYVLNGINDIVKATSQSEPSIALKGFELLGKHLKLFTDKVESTNTVRLEHLVAGANDLDSEES